MRELLPRVVEVFVLWFWALGLFMAVLWVLRARLPVGGSPDHERSDPSVPVLGWAVVALVVACFIAFALWREDFTDHDNSFFTTRTLEGRPIPPPVWPGDGRFWPLGFQEFNLIGRVATSAAGYLAWPMLQLVVLVTLVGHLLRGTPAWVRVGGMIALVATPNLAGSFAGLVYPERNMAFFLALMLVGIDLWDRRGTRMALLVAVVAAHFLLYYKEPAFVIPGAMALAGLFRTGSSGPAARDRRMEWAIVGLVVFYLLLFAVSVSGDPSLRYAERYSVAVVEAAARLIAGDPLLVPFLVAVTTRLALASIGRIPFDMRWDGLALGAVAYAAILVGLGQDRAYLLAPVDLVAILYLGHVLAITWARWPRARWVQALVVLVVGAESASLTALRLLDRKATVMAKVAFGDFLLARPVTPEDTVKLFFPATDGHRLMEMAAYLRYRGLYVEKVDDGSTVRAGRAVVRLYAPRAFPDGRCAWWRRLRCEESEVPPPGSLLVGLPDDQRPSTPASVGLGESLLYEWRGPAFLEGFVRALRNTTAITPSLASLTSTPEGRIRLLVACGFRASCR